MKWKSTKQSEIETNFQMRATPTRRKLEPTQSVPAGMAATASTASGRRSVQHGTVDTGGAGDPVIKGEINWSVSQLRSLFNQQTNSNGQQGQHSPNGGSSSSTSSSTNGGGGGGQYQHHQHLQRLQQQQVWH